MSEGFSVYGSKKKQPDMDSDSDCVKNQPKTIVTFAYHLVLCGAVGGGRSFEQLSACIGRGRGTDGGGGW